MEEVAGGGGWRRWQSLDRLSLIFGQGTKKTLSLIENDHLF